MRLTVSNELGDNTDGYIIQACDDLAEHAAREKAADFARFPVDDNHIDLFSRGRLDDVVRDVPGPGFENGSDKVFSKAG